MNKHTKGPWEASNRGDYSDFDGDSVVITGRDRRICAVHHSGYIENVSNVSLITAAPDMLEELRRAAKTIRNCQGAIETGQVDDKNVHGVLGDARDRILKVIKKAKGNN